MKIDAHHHLWRYDPADFGWIAPDSAIARDFDAVALASHLSASGIDGAVAVQARQTGHENRFLLTAARVAPILGIVGWIDLTDPAIETSLERDADPLIVGYRHIVQDEPDDRFLLGEAFVNGVRHMVARGLTYDVLVNARQFGDVPAFLDRVGAGRFVLDHAAKPPIRDGGWQSWADELRSAAACPDLFCKISGLVTEADHALWSPDDLERYLDHIFASFGPARVIWGSDWPVCLLAAEYDETLSLIERYVERHCPEAMAAVLGGNAVRAYALDIA